MSDEESGSDVQSDSEMGGSVDDYFGVDGGDEEEDPFALPGLGAIRQREDLVGGSQPSTAAATTGSTPRAKVKASHYANGKRIYVQRWVFTLYCEPWNKTGLPLRELPHNVGYICGQPEYNTTSVGELRRQHFQGFVEMSTRSTLEEVCTAIGVDPKQNWFQPSRSPHPGKAIEYTQKMESAVLDEDGESQWRELGKCVRNHVTDQYREMIAATQVPGTKFEQLVSLNGSMALRHYAGLEKFLRTFQKPEDRPECNVYFFCGETGLGKTHAVRFLEPNFRDEVYVKPAGTKWWDGYEGQKTVVFDDLRDDEFRVTDMLRYLQKFAMTVEVKGSCRPACWTKVYITTNVPIEQWYLGTDRATREAFLRRIPEENRVTFYKCIRGDGDVPPFTNVKQLASLQRRAHAEKLLKEDAEGTAGAELLLGN
jgi:hypothetical protein